MPGLDREGGGEAAVAPGLLRDQAARDLVEAQAAVLLRDLDPEEAQLPGLAQELAAQLVVELQELAAAAGRAP